MKKYIFVILLVLFIFSFKYIQASQDPTYLSYGVKLAYQFGKEGGFVYGLELSLVHHTSNGLGAIGGVLDIDYCKDNKMIHLGFEQSYAILGYDIGPTIYIKDNKIAYGETINFFTGFLIYPFYGYSHFPNEQISIHQIGTYLKIHQLMSGRAQAFDIG